MIRAMRFVAMCGLLASGCAEVSQEDTVFACDPAHPCPGTLVCTGESGICLDHEVLLYEGFEGPIDAVKWMLNEVDGNATVDATAGHWGDGALHLGTPGTGVASITHRFAAALPSHVFVRFFVRQSAPERYAPYVVLTRADTSATVNLHADLQALQLKAARDAQVVTSEGGTVLANTWSCLELEIANLPSTGDGDAEIRVFADDVELTAMQRVAGLRSLDQLQIGGYSMAPTDTLIDDVIVDTQRVGCSR